MRVLVAAGGTGGHIFPASALAAELMRRGAVVTWAGRPGSLEERVAAGQGIEFRGLPAASFAGRSVTARSRAAWYLTAGLLRCRGLFRTTAPDVVVATGGFTTAAPLAAAWLGRKPYYLLEQNRIPGRVTRTFAAGAREVYLAFPPARPLAGNCVVTGNPLLPALAAGGRTDDGRTVLVLGGSLGAQALNLAVLDTAVALTNLHFIVVTGRRDYAMVKGRVRSQNCELVEFTSQPEVLYRRATLAVSRAGGMVLSELLAFGIPAIIVPFPFAADGHQEANARHIAGIGAGVVLDQTGLSGLTNQVRSLIEDEPRRAAMSRAALAAARPDAARVIAARILGDNCQAPGPGHGV